MQPAKIEPNIVAKPAFTVVGMKYRGKNEHDEIPQLWRTFGPHMHEIKRAVSPAASYGVMDNYDEKTGEFDYLAACEVTGPPETSPGMTSKTVPSQTYAVLPTSLATIRRTYDEIYQEWLPKSGYDRAAGPEFEFYDDNFDSGNPDSEFYLYIPVERAR
jgi:AraC family transcriptional regulator